MIPRMNCLTSPLAATAIVCATMAVLALPLRHLTREPSGTTPQPNQIPNATTPGQRSVEAIIHLRLLAKASSLELRTTSGTLLWSDSNLHAGEHQKKIALPIEDHRLELIVSAEFATSQPETALFLTILPNGMEEQTRFAIGTGTVNELLDFHWPTPQ